MFVCTTSLFCAFFFLIFYWSAPISVGPIRSAETPCNKQINIRHQTCLVQSTREHAGWLYGFIYKLFVTDAISFLNCFLFRDSDVIVLLGWTETEAGESDCAQELHHITNTPKYICCLHFSSIQQCLGDQWFLFFLKISKSIMCVCEMLALYLLLRNALFY